MGEQQTILRHSFIHIRIRGVGEHSDDLVAKPLIIRPALRDGEQHGQPVIVVVLTGLELQKKSNIGCGLLPSPPTPHHVDPLYQQIHARGFGDKG